MQIIRNPADAIADPELRHPITKTFQAINDPEVLGYCLIVEPGDTLATINEQLGFSILANRWTGIEFGQPDFVPSFEILVEHAHCYEMVFIISDDGFGIEVFLPKNIDIPELLAMCQQYATLEVPASVPGAITGAD